MATTRVTPSAPTGDWVLLGILAGVVAGIAMAVFEMIAAAAMGMSALAPLRMIAGIVLGSSALGPEIDVGLTVLVGVLVHLALSALYGAIFGAGVASFAQLRRSKPAILTAGAVFGLVLWLVNFYLFAPALFPWFTEANALVQFVAHTFFFGAVLGGVVDARLRLPAPGEEEPVLRT